MYNKVYSATHKLNS